MRNLLLTATMLAAVFVSGALAAPLQAAPRLPNTLHGYWCFFSPPADDDLSSDPVTLATSFDDCANRGGVRFQRGKSSYQFGRFDWRANCQISKIDLVSPKVYRVYSHCRSKEPLFVDDPLEGNRVFEVWQRSKTELRWREIEE
jgi:hypothetical protein